jgi:uncharacterized FlgJ-related protein
MSDEKKPPAKKKKHYDLIPAAMHKQSRDFVDFDYVEKMTEEEKDWLNKFSAEYYNNNFTAENPVTPDKVARRKYYQRNNERRRDMWNEFQRMPHDYTDFLGKKEEGEDE